MLAACVGLAGAQTVDPANYANSITPMGGYTLHWTVGATFVDVGIVTEAVGYAALGIGNRMEGADIWFAGDTVTDRQGIPNHGIPVVDAQQNFESSSVTRVGGQTHFMFRRLLVSPDPTDRPIGQGPISLIAAYHTTTEEVFHSNFRVFQAELGGPVAFNIGLSDTAITPNDATQGAGTLVRFVNSGTVAHELTCTGCPEDFTSGPIAPGGTFDRTFTVQGTYNIQDSVGGLTLRMVIGAPTPTVPPVNIPGIHNSAPYHTAHAVLMATAWGLIAPVAIGAAMLDKGKTWWFPLHWVLASVVALFTLIAFAVIVADVSLSGSRHFWATAGSATKGAHGTIGLIIFIWLIGQIVVGVIIDRMWQNNKPNHTLELIHHWSGRILLIFAFIEICLGIAEIRITLGLMAVPILIFVILFFAWVEAMRRRRSEKGRHIPSHDYMLVDETR